MFYSGKIENFERKGTREAESWGYLMENDVFMTLLCPFLGKNIQNIGNYYKG
jgi:hypothetical protein